MIAMAGYDFLTVFKNRYSSIRILWLIGVISIVTLMYLTSSELWYSSDSLSSIVVNKSFIVYVLVFSGIILAVTVADVCRLTKSSAVIALVSLVSVLLDIVVISVAEFLVLLSIGVFPQDYLQGASILLLGALPASLGSITLSTVTKTLQQRNAEVYEELLKINKAISKSEEERLNKFDSNSPEWQKTVAEQKSIREKRQGQK
ncbi:MAG: hypothetical protein LBE76_01305 [Nitrososphaerota archaeon]|jgi:hypothetical protein|nr:hypothetical protein [Nitrososphaerota archaeon]